MEMRSVDRALLETLHSATSPNGGGATARRRAVDLMISHPPLVRNATKTLKKSLQSQDAATQRLSLAVVEEAMQRGGIILQQKIAEKEFLNVLVRVMKRPRVDPRLRSDILRLLGKWSNDLAHESDLVPDLQVVRRNLANEGFALPGAHLAKIYDETYERGVDAAFQQKFDGIKAQVQCAREMMACCQTVEELKANEALRELIKGLKLEAKSVQRTILDQPSGDCMTVLLEANELATSIAISYSRQIKGEETLEYVKKLNEERKEPSSQSATPSESESASESESDDDDSESGSEESNGSSEDEEEELPRRRQKRNSASPEAKHYSRRLPPAQRGTWSTAARPVPNVQTRPPGPQQPPYPWTNNMPPS